jgi:hypothetical protein
MSSSAPATVLSRTTQRRICAASGLALLVCTAFGLLLSKVLATAFSPSPSGKPFGPQTDVLAYFSANRTPVRAMSCVFALAALALLIVVASSAKALTGASSVRRSGRPGLPVLALGAGMLAAGFWLLTALLLWAVAAVDLHGKRRAADHSLARDGGHHADGPAFDEPAFRASDLPNQRMGKHCAGGEEITTPSLRCSSAVTWIARQEDQKMHEERFFARVQIAQAVGPACRRRRRRSSAGSAPILPRL